MQNDDQSDAKPSARAGWRPKRWAAEADVSRSYTYQLIDAGKLRVVKVGAATVILTSPREFLEAQATD